jgi:hypothetical protein
MLIRFPDGSAKEAVLVSLTGGVMRVAVARVEDLWEFKLVEGAWISEQCEVVSFEFPPGIGGHEEFRLAVAEAVRPMKGLPRYLSDEPATGKSVS